jgi:magnesium transporter
VIGVALEERAQDGHGLNAPAKELAWASLIWRRGIRALCAPMAEEILYWTELIGLKVYDLKGRGIGTLRDAALVPLIDPVRVDRFLVGAGPGWFSIRYDQVKTIAPDGIRLQDELLTPYHSDEYMLRMVRDLLDQQIIDAQGQKVVRINDITFLKERENGGDVLHILEIDIGLRSIVRRVLRGVVSPSLIRTVQNRIPPHSIRWEFCNMLEADPQRRVRLNISNKLLEKMHPADLADIVENLGHEDRVSIFNSVTAEVAAGLLSEVDSDIQTSIIESLGTDKAAAILEEMQPSEAADVLNELGEEQSEQILEEMEQADKEEVEELLEFRDDTAGGLMDPGFIALPEGSTVTQAMEELKKNEESIENLHDIFLVDDENRLRATVPLGKLLFAAGDTPLKEFAIDPLLSIRPDEKQDRVAEVFDKYNLLTLPVISETKELLGVITVDDVVALLRQS